MSGLLLDPKEKDRFMIYCKLQSDTSKEMLEQMGKLNLPKEVLEREKMKAFAYGFVAKELENTEAMEID